MATRTSRGTLREFYDSTFFPERRQAYSHRWAISHLSAFLGRPAMLTDVTADTLAAWRNAQQAAGLAVSTIEGRRQCLQAIAKLAIERGVLASACVGPEIRPRSTNVRKRRERRSRPSLGKDHAQTDAAEIVAHGQQTPRDQVPASPPATSQPSATKGGGAPSETLLRDFYLGEKGTNELRSSRWSIACLEEFLGYEPTVKDLTVETFDRFGEHLGVCFKGSNTRGNVERGIKRLWKLAIEGHLTNEPMPPDKRLLPRSLWSEATIEPVTAGESPVTVRQLYEHFYRPLRLRGKSEKTCTQYHINIDHLHKFLTREPLLTDLEDDVIGAFFHWFVETGRSAASGNKARNHILALWRFAARKRFVEKFPDVPRLNEPNRIPQAWSEAELCTLFAAVAAVPGEIGGVPAGAWWTALHQLLWWTAERIGAVMQLRWSDVDLETSWLIVPAEFRKFQTADKATQLPGEAIAALRAIRAPERELLFPWPYTVSTLWSRYKRILKGAGLPTGRKSKFHCMRKSAASHFEAGGGNATELLGHSSRRVTLNYLSPKIVKPQQTAAVLFNPSANRKDGAA